jgi:thiamine biosynthesis protein ThiS
MKLIVNGQAKEVEPGTTVRQVIEAARLSPEKVAIELNRRLLKTERYDTILNEGDEIEIVTFVGGG